MGLVGDEATGAENPVDGGQGWRGEFLLLQVPGDRGDTGVQALPGECRP